MVHAQDVTSSLNELNELYELYELYKPYKLYELLLRVYNTPDLFVFVPQVDAAFEDRLQIRHIKYPTR